MAVAEVVEIIVTALLIPQGIITKKNSKPLANMLCMCCLHLSVFSLVQRKLTLIFLVQFIAQAEEKISQCITVPLDPEPQIEQICGPGVDPTFDQLISALGHIASQKPKPLIDSMMLWRKNKSDAANEARSQLQQVCRPEIPCLLLAHTDTSLGVMLCQAKCFEEIPNLPIRMPMISQVSAAHPHLQPGRSLLPKPSVVPQLQYTFYVGY